MTRAIRGSTRREFVVASALSAGTLMLTLRCERKARPAPDEFRPSVWIRITRNGTVTLTVARSEMGQGVRTSLPMILAEELEVDLESVTLVQAQPGEDFPDLTTFGSRSVRLLWTPLRTAGAAAREMLISAAASRWSVAPSACRAENGHVLHESSGRRLSYGDLVEDAARQSVPRDPPLKPPSRFRTVGRDRPRVDLSRIVRGSATFASDVRVPGMKFASVIRCPVHGGKLRSWDAAAAKSVPGVRLVVPVHSGLAIIADDTWAAITGRRAVEPTIAWEEGPNAAVSSADMLSRLHEADARGEARTVNRGGDARAGLASAYRRIEAEYLYPFQAHAAMEPLVAVADARPDRCEIWAGTQSPNAAQQTAADVLGLDPSAVVLNVTLLGGGFGRRGQSDFVRDAAEASRAAGAPVQVVWIREDDMRHDYYHPISLHRMAAGLDVSGRIVAWRHRAIGPSSARSGRRPESGEQLRKDLRGAYDVPYDFPSVSAELVEASAPVRVGFWRGVQHNPNVFASECFVDELALESGHDPLDYRLHYLKGGGKFPGGRHGEPVDRARLARTLAVVAERSDWKGSSAGLGRGRGVACNVHDGGTYVAVVADISVDGSGSWRADRVVCAVDCGIAVNPLGARAQMEGGVVWALSALSAEITLSRGRVEQSSFNDFPILRLRDAPRIEAHLVASDAAPSGMGEVVNPACLAAVGNALSAATGRRLRRLPVRKEDLTEPHPQEPRR